MCVCWGGVVSAFLQVNLPNRGTPAFFRVMFRRKTLDVSGESGHGAGVGAAAASPDISLSPTPPTPPPPPPRSPPPTAPGAVSASEIIDAFTPEIKVFDEDAKKKKKKVGAFVPSERNQSRARQHRGVRAVSEGPF